MDVVALTGHRVASLNLAAGSTCIPISSYYYSKHGSEELEGYQATMRAASCLGGVHLCRKLRSTLQREHLVVCDLLVDHGGWQDLSRRGSNTGMDGVEKEDMMAGRVWHSPSGFSS